MGLLDLIKALLGNTNPKSEATSSRPETNEKPARTEKPVEPKEPARPQEENVPSVADQLMLQFLKDQGLQPHVQDDGDILFKYQMMTFIYFASHEDINYFRLGLPFIYEFSEETRPVILAAANKLNCMAKCAKFVVTDDNVWITVDTLLDSTPKLEDFVPRLLELLIAIRQEFYKELTS